MSESDSKFEGKNPEMSVLSQGQLEKSIEISSIDDALDYLENELKQRTVRDTLLKLADDDSPEAVRRLRRALECGFLQNDPDAKIDTVQHNIRNWFGPHAKRPSKEKMLEISFILDLSVEDTDRLLKELYDEGLHWREPGDLLFLYAKENNLSYEEMKQLGKDMNAYLKADEKPLSPNENDYTANIKEQVLDLPSSDEFLRYVKENADSLGTFHNTAYSYFKENLRLFMNPSANNKDTLSFSEVLRAYLYGSEAQKAADYKKLHPVYQKLLQGWPGETLPEEAGKPVNNTLENMKLRKIDVSRKVMILLFLAITPGPDMGGMYPDEELTRDDVFDYLYQELNLKLKEWGYSPLDPRAPFDWLVLFCMCVPDVWNMYDRTKDMFEEMCRRTEDQGRNA